MHFHRLIVALGACAVVAGAIAATTTGSLEPTSGTWRAYRGTGYTTLVCSASSEAAVLACAAADAERRSATTRYQIRYPNRYVTVTYSAPATAEWTLCSLEWAYCKFEGMRRVRFGLGENWVERDLTAPPGGIECWRGSFGGEDPIPAAAKQCELRVETTPPPTTEPPAPTGTATLSWIPPTHNEDGTALTNLAGYRIHYGRSPGELTSTIDVPASVTRYTVEDLAPGDWFFSVRAYTSTRDSEPSNVGSKVVL